MKLLDDDAEEFLFSGAQEKFAGFREIHFRLYVCNAHAIQLNSALFQQTVGFTSRSCQLEFYQQLREALRFSTRKFTHGRFFRRLAVAENSLKIPQPPSLQRPLRENQR